MGRANSISTEKGAEKPLYVLFQIKIKLGTLHFSVFKSVEALGHM
jgi:hypothetical protein